MLRLALVGLLLLPLAARADECDALAARIAVATGPGKVGRRVGPSIDIRTADGVRLDLTCRADPIVQAASGDPSPSGAYFRDLATAAELVVGEPGAAVRAAIDEAYRTALAGRRKSFVQQNGWSASCYADSAGALRTLCSVGRIPRG